MTKWILQERILKNTPDVDTAVPLILNEVAEAVCVLPQDRTRRSSLWIFPMPPKHWEIEEVGQTTPKDHVQNRTEKQTVDSTVPELLEEIRQMIQQKPQERRQARIMEQLVDFPVPPGPF